MICYIGNDALVRDEELQNLALKILNERDDEPEIQSETVDNIFFSFAIRRLSETNDNPFILKLLETTNDLYHRTNKRSLKDSIIRNLIEIEHPLVNNLIEEVLVSETETLSSKAKTLHNIARQALFRPYSEKTAKRYEAVLDKIISYSGADEKLRGLSYLTLLFFRYPFNDKVPKENVSEDLLYINKLLANMQNDSSEYVRNLRKVAEEAYNQKMKFMSGTPVPHYVDESTYFDFDVDSVYEEVYLNNE